MKRSSLIFLFVFALLPAAAVAQVQTGTPPFGSFGGGPDVINLANLNFHIAVPVLSKQGRGIPFTFDVTQDSSVWYPVTSNGTTSWQPVANWGWNQSEANIGFVTYTVGSSGHLTRCGDYYAGITTTIYSNWAYNDGFHTSHPFAMETMTTDNTCTNTITTTSAQATASDGSGYTLSATGDRVTQLVDTQGNNINPASGAGSITDRNGNLISLSNNGVITDTLGKTALTIAGAGTPSSPITFTYQAPSTANAVYKEIYTSYTVATNFGISGINEFGARAESLVSSIVLPDGSQYAFTYEATPSTPSSGACTPLSGTYSKNCVTARIASVTLPTGGTISYTYSGGNNGILSDGSAATLTRTTPDGTWTYAHTESGTAWTTTVTDPQGNQTVYNFQGIYQTERKVYQGSSTLLEDDAACYNGNTSGCNTTAITLPITERIITDTLGSQECKHVYFYNAYGLLTEQDDYDYGNGAPGSLLRKKLISYASLGNNIVDAPSQVTIENGSGTVVAQTSITYDGGSVVPTSGTPQQVSVSGSRGNPTSIAYLVAGTATLTKSFTYFDTGNVQTSTDVNGAPTTYSYGTASCGNSFPTSVAEPLSLSKSMVWNCNGGVETSATDENGNVTTFTYNDPNFWRTNAVTDAENNTTNLTYANPTSVERTLNFNGSSSTEDVLATLDELGRKHITQTKQSPGSNTYDSVETDFDTLGRPSRVTVPYSGTSGQTNSSAPATTTTYDALGRPTQTIDGGGGKVKWSYAANDVLQEVDPAPSGENTKQRQYEYNSVGQLTSVCEITSTLQGNGTCAQNTSATGYWTKYGYDVLGDLTGVSQNAQSTSQVQARNYTYDDLRRMTSETNPETGSSTFYYYYDFDPAGSKGGATCSGTYDGDLVKKVDVTGNVTCYTYDALHRVTSVTYPYGPNSGNTPSKYFIYNSATVNGVAMANAKARLAEAYTCVSPCSSKLTDEGFSYMARGEVSDVYQSTPHSGGYYHSTASYWANGVMQNLTASTGYTTNYNVDGEGRVYSAGPGGNQLASTTYNAASQPTTVIFASLDSDSFTYDPNTGRMTQYQFNVNGQSVTGNLGWNANGTLGSLNITDPFNAANAQSCAYTHDDLVRIASANCGSIWSQTFSYDAFGNITKSGSSQFQPGYNWQTNQMSASSGASYDSNGDVLSDGLHSYAWDANGRPSTIDSVGVTYDALGRMVEQNNGGLYTQIEYSPTGFQMELMNGQSFVKAFVPMPGGTEEVWQASGASPYYRHSDWLGSSRFASTSTRTMYNDLAFAPFGEPYAQAGSIGVTDVSFGGNDEDTVANLYDAQFREYGIQGRWPSPDPAGMTAANPANPQSWDRYAYVMNNPLTSTDPSGMRTAPEYYDLSDDEAFWAGDPLDMSGGGGGGVLFGCDEFDFIDTNSYCNQTILPIVTGTYSPFQYQYTGPLSDWQPVTFDTWDQYANWSTSVAAGAPDPCVFVSQSNGVYTGGANTTLDPAGCQNAGGTWVPPGFTWSVNSKTGVLTSSPPPAPQTGWCTATERGGQTVQAIGAGIFVWGFVADATGVGAPVGIFSQGSAALGMALGYLTEEAGAAGKGLGWCN
ncbi:MAG: RHS repeat domain-containing protein [Candidatus Acidiferrales bacterium]